MKAYLLGFLTCALMMCCHRAKADDLDQLGPHARIEGTPVLFFGVKSCKSSIIWVLLDTGHFIEFNEAAHPDDMQDLMKQLSAIPPERRHIIDWCKSENL